MSPNNAPPSLPEEKTTPGQEFSPLFLGDYSTSRPQTAQATKFYWLVVKDSADTFRVKSLNEHNLPAGVSRKLPVDEFMLAFTPEPAHFVECTLPALKGYLEENKDRAEVLDQLLEIGFALNDRESTVAAIDRIIEHLYERSKNIKFDQSREFSLYSVRLRKEKRHEAALEYCRKAFEITPADENIFFNMARVYLEMEERDRAVQCITYALKLNPVFGPALKFKRYLESPPEQ